MYMKAFITSFIEASDRETALSLVSMIVASYAWIITEKLPVGIAVGIAMHALLVIGYEALANRFSWPPLTYATAFRARALPYIQRITSRIASKVQRA